MTALEKLEAMFRQGKITRRQFLSKASALGVAAAISPALLGSKAQAATPRKGGRLRICVAGASTTGQSHISRHYDANDLHGFSPQLPGGAGL